MKNHILKPPTFTLIMLLSIQPVKIPEKITIFLTILVESSIFSVGRAKMPKNGVLIQEKFYIHTTNIFQFYQLALLSMISSIV